MKTLIIISVLSHSILALANSAWFAVMQQEHHYPFSSVRVGSVCLDWKGSMDNNSTINVWVYEGEKLVETFTAESGVIEPGAYHHGGKEHDDWYIPAHFVLDGAAEHFSLWMELQPNGSSAIVNNCVRCGGARLLKKSNDLYRELRGAYTGKPCQ